MEKTVENEAWEEYCRRVGMFMSQAEAHQAYLFGRRSRDAEMEAKDQEIELLKALLADWEEGPRTMPIKKGGDADAE